MNYRSVVAHTVIIVVATIIGVVAGLHEVASAQDSGTEYILARTVTTCDGTFIGYIDVTEFEACAYEYCGGGFCTAKRTIRGDLGCSEPGSKAHRGPFRVGRWNLRIPSDLWDIMWEECEVVSFHGDCIDIECDCSTFCD